MLSVNQSADDGHHRWLFRHLRAKVLKLFKTDVQIFEDKAQINNPL